MMPIRGQRIERCTMCGLPAELCLCSSVTTLRTRTRITVVMHRDEVSKTTNTAKLAVRMLEGAQCVSYGIRGEPGSELDRSPSLVLFPFDAVRVLRADALPDGPIRLIVPDGTWSQARKIAQRWLACPGTSAVRLADSGTSRYRLRCSDQPGALSTFEAIARAVGVIDGAANEAAMMRVFDELVVRMARVRAGGARDAR